MADGNSLPLLHAQKILFILLRPHVELSLDREGLGKRWQYIWRVNN